jgi:hypothetical protein
VPPRRGDAVTYSRIADSGHLIPVRDAAGPIHLLSMEFGRFVEVSALNPRFIAGHERLKLTVEVSLTEMAASPPPAGFGKTLEELFPGLALHLCCGDNSIDETLFRPRRRAGLKHEPDDIVDIAHLLEHLIIEFQHAVAGMSVCSGITCAYESPRSRCDIFVESPSRSVSQLCVAMARGLLNDLLRGRTPDAVHARVVKLARWFHGHPGSRIGSVAAARFLHLDASAPDAARVLDLLHEMSFISEIETSLNFSRMPVYELA